MTDTRLRNTTLVALAAGVAGILATTLLMRALGIADAPIGPTAQAPGPTVRYNTYTVVLIDDYLSGAPIVDGVWLVWVPDDGSQIHLVGLPPAPFRHQFSRALNGVPLISIQKHIRGQPMGSLVLERSDLVELASELGGLMLEGRMARGEAVLDYYLNPALSADMALRNQGAIMQSIVSRIAEKGQRIQLSDLLRLPVASSVSLETLARVAARYYPMSTEYVLVSPLLDDGP